MTYKQMWKVITILEQEIPHIKEPLPFIDHIADIYLYWQRKDYSNFRCAVETLIDVIRY